MNRVLILYAHPAHQFSNINAAFKAEAETMEGVMVHDLYETYPNFLFDVAFEQNLLREHQVIVLQHPLYWYSTPAILKEWQDIVLQTGFAYGKGGDALEGKFMTSCISAGGANEDYCKGGVNRRPIIDYLLPIRQTAALCSMSYLSPFLAQGMHYQMPGDLKAETVTQYRRWLSGLREGILPAVLEKPVVRGV